MDNQICYPFCLSSLQHNPFLCMMLEGSRWVCEVFKPYGISNMPALKHKGK